MESLISDIKYFTLAQMISCFGCFITPDDDWARYVCEGGIYTSTGHYIGSIKAWLKLRETLK